MIKVHHVHYVLLAILLSVGSVIFLSGRGNPLAQFLIGVSMAILYIAWGWVYHFQKKDLHKKVMIEYLLVGCIAIVLMAMVLRS